MLSEKNLEQFCKIPISADDTWINFEHTSGEPFPEDWSNVPTRQFCVKSNYIIFLTEVARIITEGMKWNKKARIVMEFDPSQDKFSVTVFMESGEAVSFCPWKDQKESADL